MANDSVVDVDVSFNLRYSNPQLYNEKYWDYRSKWDSYPNTYTVKDFPLHLDIEVTNRCNLSCVMCAFHSEDASFKSEPEDMDFSLYKKIIDEGTKKDLSAIKLNFRGEPMLYPKIVEAVKYAKEKGVIEVMFNTNGTLLTMEKCQELIKAGLDKIIFSVDDYRKRQYDAIRVGADFNEVYRNIYALQTLKQLKGVKYPVVRVQKIDFNNAPNEIEDYIDYWRTVADEVGIQQYFDYNKIPYNDKESNWCCAFLWQRLAVLANGDVLQCCGMPHKSKILGSAKDKSIESMWKGTKMESIRRWHKRRQSDVVSVCCLCPMRDKLITNQNDVTCFKQ